MIQAIFCILSFGAITIAARHIYAAAVATPIASVPSATTTAPARTVSTLATVAQGRAPDKGDMGATPICGIFGIQPSYSSINHSNIDRSMINDERIIS